MCRGEGVLQTCMAVMCEVINSERQCVELRGKHTRIVKSRGFSRYV